MNNSLNNLTLGFYMSIIELKEYNDGSMIKKLKEEEDCPKMLLTICNFAFTNMIQSLMAQLDAEFVSKPGRPAYPRTLLLIVVLYCFSIDITNYTKMEEECRKNKFLLIVTCGLKPTRNTFANFLNNSDAEIIKKVFVSTLVLLNDLHFLDFVKLFVDGTDALVRGSRYYKISVKELDALIQVHEWGLLHNNTSSSINRTINGLKEKLEIFENDKEMCKTINLALKRVKIYNYNVYSKKDIYLKVMVERDVDSVSITFPEACWMKTKRGIFDFAFNLQELMTENHIILAGILLAEPNDQKTIKYVLKNLYKTIELFIKMQREFGQRWNTREIRKRMREHILIVDSGYFTTENLYYLFIHKINALIMPKKIAEEHNNKLRRENEHEEKRKDSNRKGFERVKNGYTCPIGRFMRHLDPIEINHRKPHEDDNLPDICKKKRHIFKTYSCKGCPRSENCIKIIEDRISDLIFDMTNKFLDKRHNIHYKSRFSRSEGINGFLKGDDGILKLIGTTKNAVDNEIQLRNTIYNLTRQVNLTDTAYLTLKHY